MKKTQAANWIASFALVFTMLLLVAGGYLYFFEDNPPMTPVLPMMVDKDAYCCGEEIEVTLEFCRHTDAHATLYVTYVNLDSGRLYPLAPENVNSLSMADDCAVAKKVEVLPHLAPGMYIRQSRLVYHVNVLRDRMVELYTEPFEIIEGPNEE